MMKVTDEMRKRCDESSRMSVTAIQPAKATAAWPDGRPAAKRRSAPGVRLDRDDEDHRHGERDERELRRRVATAASRNRELRVATSPENTR